MSSSGEIRKAFLLKPMTRIRVSAILLVLFSTLGVVQFDHPAGIYPYPFIYSFLSVLAVAYMFYYRFQISIRRLFQFGVLLLFVFAHYAYHGLAITSPAINLLISISTAYLFFLIALRNKASLYSASIIALWIYTAVFFTQALLKVSGIGYVDMHQLIFPWSVGKGSTDSFGFARYTGLHQEPGAHATVVAVMLLQSLCLDPKVKVVHFLALLSCLLTYSTVGIGFFFFLSFYILSEYFSLNTSMIFKITVICVLGALLLVYAGAFEYLVNRYVEKDTADMSLAMKLNSYMHWWNAPITQKFSGFGLMQSGGCSGCAISGTGFFFANVFYFGLSWAFFLTIMMFRRDWSSIQLKSFLAMTLLVSVSRLPVMHVLPYFTLLLSGYSLRQRRLN